MKMGGKEQKRRKGEEGAKEERIEYVSEENLESRALTGSNLLQTKSSLCLLLNVFNL